MVNGQITRVKREQLMSIRSAQGRAFVAFHSAKQTPAGTEKPGSDQRPSGMAMETDGEPSEGQNSDQFTCKEAQTDQADKPALPLTTATKNPFSALRESDQQ